MCAKKKSEQKRNLLFCDEFYSDRYEENMLHASVVRSPVAKGKINAIDLENLPEGYSFFGFDDIPGKKSIKILKTEIPIFAQSDVDFFGQPLGIIAGPDRKLVRLLSRNIETDIDENFYYKEQEEDNILASRQIQTDKDFKEENDDLKIEGEWESELKVQNFAETNGALCYVKASKLYVFTPNLWLSSLRKSLADVTGFAEENIYINRTKILSKNKNILYLNTIICCQCAVAAINSKRPVKLEFTRTEQSLYAEASATVKIFNKTVLSKTGLIKSMDILINVNSGAYNPFAQEIADRLSLSCTGVYHCPNLKICTKIYKSHGIPCSIDFSTIDAKSFFAIEAQMNKISLQSGINPLELRLLNLKNQEKNSKEKISLEIGKAKEALDAVCKKSIFLRKNAVYNMEEKRGAERYTISPYSPPIRGIALCCAYEGTGYFGSEFLKKRLSVDLTFTEEKKLFIRAIPSSKNIWEIWKTLAATIINIPKEDVILDNEYTNKDEPESPQTTYASISICTQLIKKAAESLAKKIQANQKLPVTVRKNFSTSSRKSWDKENFCGHPFASTSFAAMVLELELDIAIYKPILRGIWFIVDAGKILNPRTAETSIKNTIQEDLAELIEDDYNLETSISIQFMQSQEEPKQIGEIASSLLLAAYSSALSQAVGKLVTKIPLQDDLIYKMIKSQKNSFTKKEEEKQ
ncbi:molybdopterin cofactor-binding domain-containing protein [Treponema pectinovorum]|uniref:molybdopterin cofactor-binding domain-containing protein n=1 Tax=Treponema pectinovorum TaxID=164 RepID=UPI0011F3628F|nr:molybdopterin cofactor-binding domain-containing protein [Treponema pectinovorum]